jgi:hypothetical protein
MDCTTTFVAVQLARITITRIWENAYIIFSHDVDIGILSTIVNLPMPDMPMNSLPLLTRKTYHLTIVFKMHRVLPTLNVPSDESDEN